MRRSRLLLPCLLATVGATQAPTLAPGMLQPGRWVELETIVTQPENAGEAAEQAKSDNQDAAAVAAAMKGAADAKPGFGNRVSTFCLASKVLRAPELFAWRIKDEACAPQKLTIADGRAHILRSCMLDGHEDRTETDGNYSASDYTLTFVNSWSEGGTQQSQTRRLTGRFAGKCRGNEDGFFERGGDDGAAEGSGK